MLPKPRARAPHTIDRVVGNAGENRGQVGLRVEAADLGGADEGVDGGGACSAGIGTGEEPILAAEGDGPERAFGRIVVDLDAPVRDVSREGCPARERITHALGELRLGGELCTGDDESRLELVEQRTCAGAAFGSTLVRRTTSDLLLDRIERADARECFLGDRRGAGGHYIMERAAGRAPSTRLR